MFSLERRLREGMITIYGILKGDRITGNQLFQYWSLTCRYDRTLQVWFRLMEAKGIV